MAAEAEGDTLEQGRAATRPGPLEAPFAQDGDQRQRVVSVHPNSRHARPGRAVRDLRDSHSVLDHGHFGVLIVLAQQYDR